MNKLLKSLGLTLFCLLLSSCVKYNATIVVNNDHSMDFSFISAIKKEYASQMSKQDFTKYKEEGFLISPYEDNEYEGYKMSKHYFSVDDVSTPDLDKSTLTDNEEKIFRVKKGFIKNTYYAKLLSNDSKEMTDQAKMYESDDEFSDETKELVKSFDMKFNLVIPTKVISSNATSVSADGKNLEWNLVEMKDQYIEFTFELYNTNNIIMLCGVGLIIFSISFFVIRYLKGTKHRAYMFFDKLKNKSVK